MKKQKPPRPPWIVTINGSEIKPVSQEEAEKGEALTWKMAFWGTYADERAIERFRNGFSKTLGQLETERGWLIAKGLELRNKNSGEELVPLDLPFDESERVLRGFDSKAYNDSKSCFHIPTSALKIIPEEMRYIRKRSGQLGRRLIHSPHLVINAKYATYSDESFIFGNQVGISAPKQDADYLKSISVYLSSSICRYLLFFVSPYWGIDRILLSPRDWRTLPIPSSNDEQKALLAKLQEELVHKESSFEFGVSWKEKTTQLQKMLDSCLEDLLNIPQSLRILVHDFLEIRLSLNKGKMSNQENSNVSAVKRATQEQFESYAEKLRDELDSFTKTGEIRHLVSIVKSNDLTVCVVKMIRTTEKQQIKVLNAKNGWKKQLEILKQVLREKFSQWIYVQREVRFFDAESEIAYICKTPRLIDWTQSQAILDSNDIISDVLSDEKSEIEIDSSFIKYENSGTEHQLHT